MSLHPFLNQIELSSVEPERADPNDQSLIDQLNMLDTISCDPPSVTKIQSFIYAETLPFSHRQHNEPQQLLFDSISMIGNSPKANKHLHRQKLPRAGHGIDQESPKLKSIRQEIIEQNKMLQQRLKSNRNQKGLNVFKQIRSGGAKIEYMNTQTKNSKDKVQASALANSNLEFFKDILQKQYYQSSVVKLYNFVLKELPICHQCSRSCHYLQKQDQYCQIVCKRCLPGIQQRQSLMGVLYDLQNKPRFEDELLCFQGALDSIDVQIAKLKQELRQVESLKQKIIQLKHLSRKNYKGIQQSKCYFKKCISNIDSIHLQRLVQLLPSEYLLQMELWQSVERSFRDSWRDIYMHLYRLMPIYIHDHCEFNLLSALHKLLNYQNEHSVKIAVSQDIKFPLKQIEKAVLVVDGSYNLPVFDNVDHLELQFENKKTMRELSLLFSNFPRSIYSLRFRYDHKVHSHISAETFPFFKHLSAFSSIKKLDVTIENIKDFSDILNLSATVNEMTEFRLKVTRHVFSQQQLILPESFFDRIFAKLGRNLVRCEINLPESIDSQAKPNYEDYISRNRLCYLKIQRGEKEKPSKNHLKLLEQLNQQKNSEAKRKESLFQRLLCQRLRLIKIVRNATMSDSLKANFIQSVHSLL